MAKKLRLTEDEKKQIWAMVYERVSFLSVTDYNLTDAERRLAFDKKYKEILDGKYGLLLKIVLKQYHKESIRDILEDGKRKSKDVI